MRKLFLVAISAAIAVAGFSVIAYAGKGDAGTSFDLSLKPNKVNKVAGMEVVFEPTKIDDQGTADTQDDIFTPTKDNTLTLPKKSSVDTKGAPRCKKTPTEVGQGEECPDKTRIGSGSTISYVQGQPVGDPAESKRQGGVPLSGTLEAFNSKSDLILVVQPCAPGTGPNTGQPCTPASQPVVLAGEWSNVTKRPKLFVETPPSLHASGVVITRLEIDIKKKSKTETVKGKEVLHSMFLTPETCDGKWVSTAHTNFTDGSEQTIKDKQTCKKPG